ncbi:MAG: STAS domain-containing protein [Alphaproteobacteria bacterium]|nr:STAS domain-containing protein [Alphaproteobacteria bacterium]
MRQTVSPNWHLFIPKLFTVLREGYGAADLRSDALSGLTVAIVALPLAMALAIASGVGPERGLYTAVVAGFLISVLGGSRFQIGGPTGAFVVVVFNVVALHGYDGLVLATLMAGAMLIVAGLAGLGTYVKYIPYPVVTGFTSGIAVIIFSSQVKDLLGLSMTDVPAEFLAKWEAYGDHLATAKPATVAVAAGTLAAIVALRRFAPKLPGFLIGVCGASLAVWALGLEAETIGQRFGEIPHTLPAPAFPDVRAVTLARLSDLLPSAFTIAFLAGVESLLSAVVADGMTGRRHRSNCELVAQGAANLGSVLMGGIPATGAIARTVTNIRSGARSPVSGMLHAVFLLLFMFFLAPLMSFVPLAALGAVLAVVAWNMSEYKHFLHLMRAPAGDRVVLMLTFALTVLVDLTVAIEVGVVLAAILFMHRMAQAVEIETHTQLIQDDVDDLARPAHGAYARETDLPDGVAAYAINGPFFFGAAARVGEILEQVGGTPRVLILNMRNVPLIDATGFTAMTAFLEQCHATGTRVILSGVRPQPRAVLKAMCAGHAGCDADFAANFTEARTLAATLAGDKPL